jgi:hypothetical protein
LTFKQEDNCKMSGIHKSEQKNANLKATHGLLMVRESIRQNHPADRAVLPGDRLPALAITLNFKGSEPS